MIFLNEDANPKIRLYSTYHRLAVAKDDTECDHWYVIPMEKMAFKGGPTELPGCLRWFRWDEV